MKRTMAMIMVLIVLCGLLVGCKEDTGTSELEAVTKPSEPVRLETIPEPAEPEDAGDQELEDVEDQEPAPTEVEYFYESKYTRLSEEPLTELIPDENYGCILPYCAGLEVEHACGDLYGHYGFMDASGRIIVDPVYQYIEPLIARVGYDFTPCVWLMTRGEIRQDEYMGSHNYLINGKCGLATADGSVVIDLIYDDIEVIGNGIFAKRYLDEDYEKYDVDIYNFDCELVESIKNLDVYIEGYSEEVLRVEKEWDSYYMDLSGKIFAGPFRSAEDFSCGYGLVEIEHEYGSYFNYVDKKGKFLDKKGTLDSQEGWTITSELGDTFRVEGFYGAESFVNGVASVEQIDMWEQYNVLTTDNTFLFDFQIFNEYRCTEDYIFDNVRGSTEVYNHAGELLWSVPELELQYVYGCDDAFLYDFYNNKIYNWKTGEIMDCFEGVTDVIIPYPYEEDFPYLLFEDEGKEESILADKDLNVIARMEQYAEPRRDEVTGRYYFIDEREGKLSLVVPHLPQPILNIEEIAANKNVCIYNDLIQCTDGGGCFYYNYDLELVFCYAFNDHVQ